MNNKHIELPQAIVYDVDGTLSDSLKSLLDVPRLLVKFFKISVSSDQIESAMQSYSEGMGSGGSNKISFGMRLFCNLIGQRANVLIISLLFKMMAQLGIPFSKRLKGLLFVKDYLAESFMKAPLYPGVVETLKRISSTYKIPFGIQTMGTGEEFFHRFGHIPEFLALFDHQFIIGRNDVKNLKPAPDGLLLLSQRWNISPESIWMVGDMDADIISAKQAKAKSIGVLTGFLNKHQMLALNPDFIIDSVANLEELLP
jgi:phosphoglycolate phosphatase-like HAD superfamily hydrolase